MDNKAPLISNIWKFYLFHIFEGTSFAIPIIVLFWQDNGLNMTQIMLLQSIFAIMIVTLEIPSGYFADLYGRKYSLLISGIAYVLGMSTYALGSGFYEFLVAELFIAVALSFTSGALSAFLYDTLIDLGEEKQYKKIWGNGYFLMLIGIAITNIAGGFIAEINLRYAVFANVPFLAIMIPIALSMYEPKRHKLIIKKGYLKKILATIKTALFDNHRLRWLIIYSGIIYAFVQSALWLYQPYFKLSGLDIAYFGFVFASFQVVAAISSKYAHKIEEKLGRRYSLGMLIFLLSGSYFLMSNFIYLFSFVFAFIHQFVRGYRNVIFTDYINQEVSSDIRATVLSVESFFGNLLYATVIPGIGYIADVYTLTQAIQVLAFTTLIIGIIFIINFRKYLWWSS